MSLLLFVAEEKGLFSKHGLEVTFKEYQSGGLAVSALADGKHDAAVGAEFLLAKQNLQEPKLRTIASISSVNNCELIVNKDSGISSIEDLRGKRIGASMGTSLFYVLSTFLVHHRLPRSSVQIVDLNPMACVEALLSGRVDAIAAFSPYTSRARERMGERALSWPIQLGQDYYFLILCTPDLVSSRPGAAEKLLRALIEAQNLVKADKAQAQAILRKRLKISEEDASAVWGQQINEVRLDQGLLLLMEAEARWFLFQQGEKGKKVPNYLRSISWEPLEKVDPKSVGIIR